MTSVSTVFLSIFFPSEGTGGNLCRKCNKSFPDDQYSQHLVSTSETEQENGLCLISSQVISLKSYILGKKGQCVLAFQTIVSWYEVFSWSITVRWCPLSLPMIHVCHKSQCSTQLGVMPIFTSLCMLSFNRINAVQPMRWQKFLLASQLQNSAVIHNRCLLPWLPLPAPRMQWHGKMSDPKGKKGASHWLPKPCLKPQRTKRLAFPLPQEVDFPHHLKLLKTPSLLMWWWPVPIATFFCRFQPFRNMRWEVTRWTWPPTCKGPYLQSHYLSQCCLGSWCPLLDSIASWNAGHRYTLSVKHGIC